jgi:hypothetical protein
MPWIGFQSKKGNTFGHFMKVAFTSGALNLIPEATSKEGLFGTTGRTTTSSNMMNNLKK